MVEETETTTETEETTEEEVVPEEKTEVKVEKTEEKTEERVQKDDDWRTKSRKNETRAKKAEKELAEVRERLQKIDEANQSEQEKAIAKAREEARNEVLTESQKERRADRLEVASTRLAATGIEVGEGESKKTVRFADPEDALVHVERAIRSGDLDEDDIYDDNNKVKQDGLRDALVDILDRKPHLVAKVESNGGSGKPKGGSDAGRGGSTSKTLEEMTPDDHLKQIQGR